MTTPRSREEILENDKNIRTALSAPNGMGEAYVKAGQNMLIIELMCDIRDALTKKNPTDL